MSFNSKASSSFVDDSARNLRFVPIGVQYPGEPGRRLTVAYSGFVWSDPELFESSANIGLKNFMRCHGAYMRQSTTGIKRFRQLERIASPPVALSCA